MPANYRYATYIVAMIAALVVGGLVLFGVVDTQAASAAVGVVVTVFAGIFGLAAKNTK